MEKLKLVGINFDHMHMGDLLRQAYAHEDVEVVGICDEQPERMQGVIDTFGVPESRVFTDYRQCLEVTTPDIAVLCPATATHGLWTERVAAYNVNVLVEKPFAASLAEADAMIGALETTGKQLVINWPLAYYPPHVTTKRLIDEGRIGEVTEVHYYDGNRGPLRHLADKAEVSAEEAARRKRESWWYSRERGGGSLNDYLGYGVTLGTWFHGGKKPLEVMTMVDEPAGLEVDEHSITLARYACGLSKFETRWGTFSDPWTLQPQPKCGFVVVGTAGTISSYDYEKTVRVQTEAHPEGEEVPVRPLELPFENPIQSFVHSLQSGDPIYEPLSPVTCRIGQQLVDTAVQSAKERRALKLLEV